MLDQLVLLTTITDDGARQSYEALESEDSRIKFYFSHLPTVGFELFAFLS